MYISISIVTLRYKALYFVRLFFFFFLWPNTRKISSVRVMRRRSKKSEERLRRKEIERWWPQPNRCVRFESIYRLSTRKLYRTWDLETANTNLIVGILMYSAAHAVDYWLYFFTFVINVPFPWHLRLEVWVVKFKSER